MSEIIWGIVAALVTIVAGALTNKFFRPNLTPREELQEVRDDREEDRKQLRLLSDYTHNLRDHIADEKGPPPPPWPEGLNK